jgi:hypothetical protein
MEPVLTNTEDVLNEEFEGSSERMYEYMKNAIRKITHEESSIKIKKNYRTNWKQQKFWEV